MPPGSSHVVALAYALQPLPDPKAHCARTHAAAPVDTRESVPLEVTAEWLEGAVVVNYAVSPGHVYFA